MIHHALARVALRAGDSETFSKHLEQVSRYYHPTENPALIAQYTALAEQGKKVAEGSEQFAQGFHTTIVTRQAATRAARAVLSQCAGPDQRAERALELLLEATGASDGFLYITTNDAGVRLAAPQHGDPPPPDVEEELTRVIADIAEDDPETALLDLMVNSDEEEDDDSALSDTGYRSVLLQTRVDGDVIVVGAAALNCANNPYGSFNYDFLDTIARGLYDSGDAVTVFEDDESPLPIGRRVGSAG